MTTMPHPLWQPDPHGDDGPCERYVPPPLEIENKQLKAQLAEAYAEIDAAKEQHGERESEMANLMRENDALRRTIEAYKKYRAKNGVSQ